ncbi:MAG: 5-methyltetrahydropteroyltriglutamate--homocysteine methyltransferase [Gammaproteobacteria bacterium]|nr:5-methyltetrahydropteroyltriglutamate--homocysteine methyltransferase [Gammaproteobacteria bacterium]
MSSAHPSWARRPLPAGLVGSYAQPDWLVHREVLGSRLPPRVHAREFWRLEGDELEDAQRRATLAALDDQIAAGVDFVTDGEIRRESYSNRFANALEGIDLDRHGVAIDRTGREVPVPRVAGPIVWRGSTEGDYVALLKAHTDLPVKVTLPGPFTMTQQAQNDYYPDEETLAEAYATAVNAELTALFAAGADIVQLDEPYVQARPDQARAYAVACIDRALAGATGTTALHVCFGYGRHVEDKPNRYEYLGDLDACRADEISIECAQPNLDLVDLETLPHKTIHVGVINLRDTSVETPETVAGRIRAALEHLPAERMVVAPDCGMKYLTPEIARGKLTSMVAGRDLVLRELGLE